MRNGELIGQIGGGLLGILFIEVPVAAVAVSVVGSVGGGVAGEAIAGYLADDVDCKLEDFADFYAEWNHRNPDGSWDDYRISKDYDDDFETYRHHGNF